MAAEKKTVAEELVETQLRNAKRQEKLLETQLVKAELDNDIATEENSRRIAERAQKARERRERQMNMRIGDDAKRKLQADCEHLQGAPISNPTEGGDESQSMLVVTRMPDGWTRLIQCGNCRGMFYTPHPRFMQEQPFKAGQKMPAGIVLGENWPVETPAEAKIRVAKYYADDEAFQLLLKKAKKKKSDEAKQEGDSGTSHTNILKKTGQQVFAWRSCDTWPQVDLKAQAEEMKEAA